MSLLLRPATLPSNAQLTALLDGIDDLLLLVLDARLRVSYRNPAAQRLLGCEAGQPVDQALAWLQPAARAAVQQVLAGPPTADAATPLPLDLAEGPLRGQRLLLTLQRSAGGGWALRGPANPPAPPQPLLPAGATSELVRLLWDSPQPLTVQDRRFVTVAANRAFFDAVGRSPDQVLGHDPLSYLNLEPGAAAALEAQRRNWLAALDAGHQLSEVMERQLVDAQGRLRYFRSAPRWVSADDGAPLLLALLQDVTLEHQARDAAAQSDTQLDQWFDLSPIGMLVYDRSGRVVRSNAAFADLVGHVPAQLLGAPADLCALLAWQGDQPLPALQPGRPPHEVLATLALSDGRRQRLRARLRAFASAQGAMHVMAVVEDRSLEDEHDLAQLEIGALMDTASVGVATYEASRGWLQARPPRSGAGALTRSGAAAPSGGAAPPGLAAGLQSIGRDQVDPASRDEFERLQRALREGQRAQVRYAVQVPGLGTRWLLTRVEPGELTGGRAALSVVTLDVTEQEEAHRRSERLLRELQGVLDGSSAGIATLRGPQLVRCNRSFEAMLGLAPGAAAGALLADLLADQPAVQALLRQALDDAATITTAAAAGQPGAEGRLETEFSRPGPDGRPVWLALSASRAAAAADGAPELVLVLTDVSRLKAQQAELEALARERALMFSLSDVGLTWLRGSTIERANAAMARLTGYAEDTLQGMPLSALFQDAQDFDAQWQQEQRSLAGGGRWQGERQLRRHDGRTLWVQVSKRRVDEADTAAGLICSYVDVDERRRAREAVQLQAERTRAILDSVLVGIVTVGAGGIEWMNRSARRMFGGELADFVGEPIAIVATSDPDHPLRATHYLQHLADGQAETFECRLRGRDGREFWVVGNAVVTGRSGDAALPGADAAPEAGSQITFALLDIERRREAEVRIAQAQASLQRIIDTAPLAIALFDSASGMVLRMNHMAAMFFGRPMEAVLGRQPDEWFGPADAAALRADLQAAQARTEVLRRELPRPVRSGSEEGAIEQRTWDVRIVSLQTGEGGGEGGGGAGAPGASQLLLVASDVTEQRAAEQARFDAAVSQREMLVKEVHHRIKNNLQGVAGLLQQTAARRPEVAVLIGEAVGQVQAIAQVHGLQVGASGPLRVKPLVDAIAASVQRTFGRPITVAVQGTPAHRFALPEAESIPIALTVNELLTNAIKHGAPGEIRCVLHFDEARLAIQILSPGQLRPGFSLAQVPPGVSGLGLVRALLPRRTATLTLQQAGVQVEAKVVLVPPSIHLLEPL